MARNEEATAELRSQFEQLNLKEVSFSTIGHAAYAWLNETKAGPPFSTPDAASQMVGMLSKGQTLGEVSQDRFRPFFEMLATQTDPSATVQEWSLRNGHEPQAPGTGGGHVGREPTTSEPEPIVFNVDESLRPLLDPIIERYEGAQAVVDQRQAELDAAKHERNVLLNILKAAGVVERKKYVAKQAAPPKAKKSGPHISEESALKILEEIRGYLASNPPALPDVPASFTRPDIERGLGLHHSKVSAAVDRLRDLGHVRAAGITTSPTTNQKTNVYALT